MTSKQSLEKVIEILSKIKEILKCSKQKPEIKPTPTPEPTPEPKISDEEFKQKVLAIIEEYVGEDVDLVTVYEAAKQ
jgi:hypothetical protein